MIQCLRIPVADPIKLFFFANKEFLLFAATLGIYYQLLPPFQKKSRVLLHYAENDLFS